jgi:hypothetical protein
MARVVYNSTQLTAPNWLGGFRVGADAVGTVTPFGALVKAELFPADSMGKRYIQSGTLLGRRDQISDFEPVATAMTTDLATTLTEGVAATADTVTVASTSGYMEGDSVTVGGAAKTVKSVDHQNSKITFTATVGSILAEGAPIALAAPEPQTDFYLLLEDIHDANVFREASLARHQALVKPEWLPGYADLDPAVQAVINENYQTYAVPSQGRE